MNEHCRRSDRLMWTSRGVGYVFLFSASRPRSIHPVPPAYLQWHTPQLGHKRTLHPGAHTHTCPQLEHTQYIALTHKYTHINTPTHHPPLHTHTHTRHTVCHVATTTGVTPPWCIPRPRGAGPPPLPQPPPAPAACATSQATPARRRQCGTPTRPCTTATPGASAAAP